MKTPEMLGFNGKYLADLPKGRQVLTFVLRNRQKSAIKHSIENHIVFSFVNLSTIFFVQDYRFINRS